ncbi:MAG TPA: hypothetical protein VKS81_09350, partial [Bacteroidota bacterium]|nr:hypothetical protein [Bacteroidota bacterium]
AGNTIGTNVNIRKSCLSSSSLWTLIHNDRIDGRLRNILDIVFWKNRCNRPADVFGAIEVRRRYESRATISFLTEFFQHAREPQKVTWDIDVLLDWSIFERDIISHLGNNL